MQAAIRYCEWGRSYFLYAGLSIFILPDSGNSRNAERALKGFQNSEKPFYGLFLSKRSAQGVMAEQQHSNGRVDSKVRGVILHEGEPANIAQGQLGSTPP